MLMKYVLDVFNEFCKYVGFKININKIECILLGILKNFYDEFYGIKIINKVVRCFFGIKKIMVLNCIYLIF